MVALIIVTAGLGTAVRAAADLGTNYQVLEPEGPGGCKAVVREAATLFAGSGALYPVGISGIGWRASSWTADDGYRPIAAGSYELRWSQDGGSLMVHGRATDPVWPALHVVRCR